MSISDADYALWLARDNARALLVEAKAYSGGAEVTRYLANRAYVSGPAATPANTAYDDIVVGVPEYMAELSAVFMGASLPTFGQIAVLNEGGVRDAWLTEAWDGRALSLYLGDPSWDRADFRPILSGRCQDIVAPDRQHLALLLRGKEHALGVSIQTSLVGGTEATANHAKPLTYGQCFNVEPVLLDASLHKYQVHDGAIEAITDVREDGVSTPYTADLGAGTFVLTNAPTGRITADVKGAKPSGSYKVKCADIIEHIVTSRAALTGADLDATNFSAFATTCPQTLGLYIRDGGGATVAEALDALVSSVGGFWTFSPAGLLTLGRLEAPSGAADLELTADDAEEDGVELLARVTPVKTVRLGYQRNWSVQSDGLAGAVTEANRAAYGTEYRVATATNGGIGTTHLLAQEPDVIPTLLVSASDAATEASRRATLWGSIRTVHRLRSFSSPLALRLGQQAKLTHPRFGFSAGATGIVVGIRGALAGRATVDLWR
jgi:hypothetical protein